MKTDNKKKLIPFLVILLLLSAVLVDRFLPNRIIVASIYFIPILIVAFFYSASLTVLTSALVIIVFVTEELFEKHDTGTVIFNILGFVLMGFLAVQFSYQRLRAQQKADEANDARERLHVFLSMIAHDLSQPLTSIKLFLHLAEKERDTGKINKLRKNVVFSVGQAQRLVDDLRNAAAIESGAFTLNVKKTDMVEMMKRIISQQKIDMGKGTIKLKAPKRIRGEWDEERLCQLFTNLLSNAIKYSPEKKEIEVKLSAKGEKAVISVSDNGLGMTEEQVKKVFEPFSRFHHETAKGMGLGLYISYGIVRAHQGKIWAKSTPGKGSTFFVELPRKR